MGPLGPVQGHPDAQARPAAPAIPILAQMNTTDIDEVLAEALLKNRPVSIQLNQKDYLGRQTEAIVGYFRGSLTENKILINNQWISMESIRNRTDFFTLFICTCLWQDKPTYNCSAKVHNSASSLGQKKSHCGRPEIPLKL